MLLIHAYLIEQGIEARYGQSVFVFVPQR